jgi:acylglycerol lipase
MAVAAVKALVRRWVVDPVLHFLSPRHAVEFATPDRKPPNPRFFPFYFQNRQYLWLRWQQWVPKREPRGVIFLVSGLAEHTGRYDSVALRFVEHGYHVFALDHQGQGLSEGERKHVERFSHYVDDLEQFVDERLATNDGALAKLPRFILGHSMGGLITTHLCMRHPSAFNGVILSAPALIPDPVKITPLLKRLALTLGEFVPKLGLDNLDSRLVSRNPQVYQQYVQDPGVPKNLLRARWGAEMLRAMDVVWAQPTKLCFPMLIIHGSADGIVPLEASERLAQTAPAADKKIVVYDGVYHELFQDERIEAAVFADVFSFIDARAAKGIDAFPRRS